MMGRQRGQVEMILMDLSELIPEDHLLKAIDRSISFEFVYGLMAPLYAGRGRPSVDPVSVVKMLLVGYLYGIKSERRLVEEIHLNVAYRWFCGFRLTDNPVRLQMYAPVLAGLATLLGGSLGASLMIIRLE